MENVGNAITPLPIDQFERNLGDRIPSYPQHVRHDAVAMVTAVAMLTALAMNILVLWGVVVWRSNTRTILTKLRCVYAWTSRSITPTRCPWSMPSWYNEMKNLVGKQQILIQKT